MNPLPLLASDNTSSADHIMTINDVMVFTKALKLRSLLFGSHFTSHPGNIFVWTANTSGIISFVLAVFFGSGVIITSYHHEFCKICPKFVTFLPP